MYKFTYKERFPCSAKEAFDATTVDFDGLEKYIDNVSLIRTLEREERPDGAVRTLLRFHGEGAIPVPARPIIKPEMLRWNEELICDPQKLTIEWSIVSDHFTEHLHCGGVTTYHDREGGSLVVVDGHLSVTLEKFPGVPDAIVRAAVRMFEPFVGRLAAPNLGRFYKAVKKRMRDERR